MKNTFRNLLFLFVVSNFLGCKKTETIENPPDSTYLMFFQKDSVAKYLTPAVLLDTTGVRSKLTNYTVKILHDNATADYKIKSTFYGGLSSCGTIIDLYQQKDISALRSDKRIDSLVKSKTFKAF